MDAPHFPPEPNFAEHRFSFGLAALPAVGQIWNWFGGIDVGVQAYPDWKFGAIAGTAFHVYAGERFQASLASPILGSSFAEWTGPVGKPGGFSILAGFNQVLEPKPLSVGLETPGGSLATVPISFLPEGFGVLVGVSYVHRWGGIWLKLSPSYVFANKFAGGVPEFARSGLPLLEVGTEINQVLDISLRLALTPIRVGLRF